MRTFVHAYTAECKDSKQNIVIIIIYCHERMRSFVIFMWLVMGKFVEEVEAGNINETGAKHILAKKIYVRILCCSYLYTSTVNCVHPSVASLLLHLLPRRLRSYVRILFCFSDAVTSTD